MNPEKKEEGQPSNQPQTQNTQGGKLQRKLKFKTLDGNIKTLECDYDIKISELKKKLAEIYKIEPMRQRLINKGKQFKDDDYLDKLVDTDDTTIHLVFRSEAEVKSMQENSQNNNNNNNNTNQNQNQNQNNQNINPFQNILSIVTNSDEIRNLANNIANQIFSGSNTNNNATNPNNSTNTINIGNTQFQTLNLANSPLHPIVQPTNINNPTPLNLNNNNSNNTNPQNSSDNNANNAENNNKNNYSSQFPIASSQTDRKYDMHLKNIEKELNLADELISQKIEPRIPLPLLNTTQNVFTAISRSIRKYVIVNQNILCHLMRLADIMEREQFITNSETRMTGNKLLDQAYKSLLHVSKASNDLSNVIKSSNFNTAPNTGYIGIVCEEIGLSSTSIPIELNANNILASLGGTNNNSNNNNTNNLRNVILRNVNQNNINQSQGTIAGVPINIVEVTVDQTGTDNVNVSINANSTLTNNQNVINNTSENTVNNQQLNENKEEVKKEEVKKEEDKKEGVKKEEDKKEGVKKEEVKKEEDKKEEKKEEVKKDEQKEEVKIEENKENVKKEEVKKEEKKENVNSSNQNINNVNNNIQNNAQTTNPNNDFNNLFGNMMNQLMRPENLNSLAGTFGTILNNQGNNQAGAGGNNQNSGGGFLGNLFSNLMNSFGDDSDEEEENNVPQNQPLETQPKENLTTPKENLTTKNDKNNNVDNIQTPSTTNDKISFIKKLVESPQLRRETKINDEAKIGEKMEPNIEFIPFSNEFISNLTIQEVFYLYQFNFSGLGRLRKDIQKKYFLDKSKNEEIVKNVIELLCERVILIENQFDKLNQNKEFNSEEFFNKHLKEIFDMFINGNEVNKSDSVWENKFRILVINMLISLKNELKEVYESGEDGAKAFIEFNILTLIENFIGQKYLTLIQTYDKDIINKYVENLFIIIKAEEIKNKCEQEKKNNGEKSERPSLLSLEEIFKTATKDKERLEKEEKEKTEDSKQKKYSDFYYYTSLFKN